jgi:hypothetical protein
MRVGVFEPAQNFAVSRVLGDSQTSGSEKSEITGTVQLPGFPAQGFKIDKPAI